MKNKFLQFKKQPAQPNRKTDVYEVFNISGTIGYIQWFSQWRKYVFHPNNDTIWDSGCLSEVTKFLDKLMLDHKVKLQNSKQSQL